MAPDGSQTRVPQILMGASSSKSTGWFMKISRALVQRLRICSSVRLTCLPGREPRTSKSFSMISSISGVLDDDVAGLRDADAISPTRNRSKRHRLRRVVPRRAPPRAPRTQRTVRSTEGRKRLLFLVRSHLYKRLPYVSAAAIQKVLLERIYCTVLQYGIPW